MKLINLFLFLFLLGCVSCKSPEENIPNESIQIIPLPNNYELKPGSFCMNGQTTIGIDTSDTAMVALAEYFNEKTSDATGFSLPIGDSGTILFQLGDYKELGEEGYQCIQASWYIQRHTICSSTTPSGDKIENSAATENMVHQLCRNHR